MEDAFTFQSFVEFTLRHRFRILKALVATVAVVMIATFLWPPVYEAQSLLLVKYGREYMYRPEVGDRDTVAQSLNRDRQTAQINTELQILSSQDLIEEVVGKVGVNRLYPKISDQPRPGDPTVFGAAVMSFQKNLQAVPVKDTDVIQIAFRHSDPKLTAQALNVLVDAYMAKHLSAFSGASATGFLEAKVAGYRKDLLADEEKLKTFQEQTRLLSVDEQRSALFAQRRYVEAAGKVARNEIAGLEQKLAYLRAEKAKTAGDASRINAEQSKTVVDARAQLLELRLEEQKLLSTFSEESRSVENVRKQIKLVEEFLGQQQAAIGQGEFGDDLGKQIIATVAELHFQQAKADNLAAQVTKLDQQITELTGHDSEYQNLVREREAAEKNYQTYEKKLEEFQASAEMDRQKIANITVIQAAAVPTIPVLPMPRLNLVVALLLGIALGYGWGLAKEYRQRRRQPAPTLVPALVDPGTIHWRRRATGRSADPEDPSAPRAATRSGA
jgi:uncharacterized protein involved in exopolysaccharide biosynthesis